MSGARAATWTAIVGVSPAEHTDGRLVEAARRGDAQAFSALAARHQRVVYNLAFRFMREPGLAEDMAQEAFLKAFRMLHRFRGDCAFSTWMYRITCNVCLSELNRRKRRQEVPFEPRHDPGAAPDGLERADLPEIVRRCVTRLPARYAQAVTLYYLDDIPYEEAAAVMQIPVGTLKTWMHRARKQLRAIIEEEIGHDALD